LLGLVTELTVAVYLLSWLLVQLL